MTLTLGEKLRMQHRDLRVGTGLQRPLQERLSLACCDLRVMFAAVQGGSGALRGSEGKVHTHQYELPTSQFLLLLGQGVMWFRLTLNLWCCSVETTG